MELVKRTLQHLQDRRNKIMEGGINSIPSPFKRFSNDFVGIEQGKYYVITSGTKVGKTQFTSFTFLYNSLLYAYEHPEQIKLTVFYYALEEKPEDITERLMSFLLYKYSNKSIRTSTTKLRSTKNDEPVEQEILDKLGGGEYAKFLEFYENSVVFPQSRNPTGVYNDVRRYMAEHGSIVKRKQKVKDEFGETTEVSVFDHYIPDNPNEYVLVFVDHVALLSLERGMSLKQTIDKLSEYCVLLRNNYNVTSIVIQQQNFDSDGLEAFKEKKLRPTPNNTGDSRYPARDCNVMLGLFSPFKYELPEYFGYDITKFKDNIRFLEVLLNRGGNAGGMTALFFDGATCNFFELPKANDKASLNKVYQYLDKIRNKPKPALLLYGRILGRKNRIKRFLNRLFN